MSTDQGFDSCVPVAYAYELAHAIDKDGNYADWRKGVTFFKPSVSDQSIRNLVALLPAPMKCLKRFHWAINFQRSRIEALEARINQELAKPAECSVGVGQGFVHGEYEAVKAVQQFIFRAEREARLERLLKQLFPDFSAFVDQELSDGGCGPEMQRLIDLRKAIQEELALSAQTPEQVKLVISRLYSVQAGNVYGAEITIITTSGKEYPVRGKIGSPDAHSEFIKYVDAPLKAILLKTPNTYVTIDGVDW